MAANIAIFLGRATAFELLIGAGCEKAFPPMRLRGRILADASCPVLRVAIASGFLALECGLTEILDSFSQQSEITGLCVELFG